MLKKDLRQKLMAKRKKLTDVASLRISDQIRRRTIDFIDWNSVDNIHIYVDAPTRREIATRPLLTYVWSKHPRIKTYMPIVAGDSMRAALIDKNTVWQTDSFGFSVPKSINKAEAGQSFDIVIVPVLGFDRRGFRLGYGKGHYDRFLAKQKHGLSIGLAYDFSKLQAVGVEKHDVRLDNIITETQIFSFD